jgi:outer membrane translocation and assembly module TamA
LRAQERTIAATVAGHGSDIDSALQNSLNLSAAPDGSDPDRAIEQVRADRERLNAVLRAFGLYEGRIDVLVNGRVLPVDRPEAAATLRAAFDEGKVHIVFVPTFGPAYRIRSIRVAEGREPNAETRTLSDDESGLSEQISGRIAMAETMARVEATWLLRLKETGHGLAAVVARTASPDANSHSVDVTLAVDEGPEVRLGRVRFQGLQRIDPDSLEQYVPFRSGDSYRPALIDRLRTTLRHLPFFQSVRVDLATALDGSGQLPVTVTVVEKPPGSRQLLLSGLMGAAIFGLSAAMLAFSQLAAAGGFGFWERHGRRLKAATWIFLIASALLGLQRLLYLGNA